MSSESSDEFRWERHTASKLGNEGGEEVVIFSQIIADGPMSCGRSACGRWVNDRQQAIFIVSSGVTIPFCCQACFAMSCQEQVMRHQDTNPLERLGYVPQDTR